MSAIAAPWFALTFIVAAFACAFAAATTRSLVASCLALWGAAALAVGALVVLGRSEAALATALVAAALAPVLLLATLLLSTRAAKGGKRTRPWLTMLGAVSVIGAMMWGLPNLGPAPEATQTSTPSLFFIGPLILVAIATVTGLLGFGERGALEKFAEPTDE